MTTYAFDPTNAETRANLRARVCLNSFSESRYSDFVNRTLNDAVTEICRKVGYPEAYEVQAFGSDGVLTISSSRPWFRIDEVWYAQASAANQGEVNFMKAALYELNRLDDHVLGALMGGSTPLYYIVRRATSPTGFVPSVDVRILPPGTGGYVAIKGLQRPAVMDVDTDFTGLGADLDAAVIAYTKARCFENEDDTQMAAFWDGRYDAELRKALEGGVDGDDDSPDVVDGMWDS